MEEKLSKILDKDVNHIINVVDNKESIYYNSSCLKLKKKNVLRRTRV